MKDDEEEGGGKKEVLFVEGVDINSISHAELMRHVNNMLEDLVGERAERGRAQAEADLARTAWENAERELREAKCRLIKMRLEAERLGPVERKKQHLILPDTTERKAEMERKVKGMAKMLPEQLDKCGKLSEKWDEGPAEDAGKEVVQAIDEHIAFAELHLQGIETDRESVLVRERYLRTFHQLELMGVEAEKNQLVHDLALVHEDQYQRIRDYFKRIIQNQLFLMMCLKERIAAQTAIRDERRHAVVAAQRGIAGLKRDMRTLLNQMEKDVRKARMYESNRALSLRYDSLIAGKEEERERLYERKRELEEKMAESASYKQMYLEVMEQMKVERQEMLDRFKEADVFTGFDRYFDELMTLLGLEEAVEKRDPGVILELRRGLEKERRVVKVLEKKTQEQIEMTRELARAAEERLRKACIQAGTRFRV